MSIDVQDLAEDCKLNIDNLVVNIENAMFAVGHSNTPEAVWLVNYLESMMDECEVWEANND